MISSENSKRKMKKLVRNHCRQQKSQYSDLGVQLEVFNDQREADEELSNRGPPGIDLSSHVEVFYAILGQASTSISIIYKFIIAI